MSALVMPQAPAPDRERIIQNEWAVRYGVLMGGTPVVQTPGWGEFWRGHAQIYRRRLTGFVTQTVGVRNELRDSVDLDQPGGSLLSDPLREPRVMDKSPFLCMREMIMELGSKGFINIQTLLGVPGQIAEQLFNVVLPAEIADKPIVDVIDFLQEPGEYSFLGEHAERAELLREELLQGAFVARDYMKVYTDATTEEMGDYDTKKTGKHKVDEVDRAYFWELKLTLPENRRKEANTELGRTIAQAVQGNGQEAVAVEMREANRLKQEELEIRRRELELKEAALADASTTTERAKRPNK